MTILQGGCLPLGEDGKASYAHTAVNTDAGRMLTVKEVIQEVWHQRVEVVPAVKGEFNQAWIQAELNATLPEVLWVAGHATKEAWSAATEDCQLGSVPWAILGGAIAEHKTSCPRARLKLVLCSTCHGSALVGWLPDSVQVIAFPHTARDDAVWDYMGELVDAAKALHQDGLSLAGALVGAHRKAISPQGVLDDTTPPHFFPALPQPAIPVAA